VPWHEEALALVTLEPLWSVFDFESAWWNAPFGRVPPWLRPALHNPLYVLGAFALVAWGRWRRWLDWRETALVLGLVLIPYVLRGYDMGMFATGRFVSVAFPLYLVAGRLLCALPPPVAAILLALAACLMAVYSALFAAGYPVA
jgi:hypothetical protein